MREGSEGVHNLLECFVFTSWLIVAFDLFLFLVGSGMFRGVPGVPSPVPDFTDFRLKV